MKNNKKYFVVGFHCTGKKEILDDLESLGVKVGRLFTNNTSLTNIYQQNMLLYNSQDIDTLFENQAYIFLQKRMINHTSYYEGLSLYEYDNNDVFMLTPNQFNNIPIIPNDVVVLWLDNNVSNRKSRFLTEKRDYDFLTEENYENGDIMEFIDKINENNPMYFNNEDPLRVSAVIYSLVKNPQLYSVYKKRYV